MSHKVKGGKLLATGGRPDGQAFAFTGMSRLPQQPARAPGQIPRHAVPPPNTQDSASYCLQKNHPPTPASRGALEKRSVSPREAPASRTSLRVLDLLGLLFMLPVALPLGFLVALFIKLASRGPVHFRQERVGYRGSRFICLKFRTMHVDADHAAHREHARSLMHADVPMTKLDSQDPRLIPLGRLLRASGLDELPQLVNVLWGEMRLVGPRPCLPYEYEEYAPWQKRRFEAVPGLTGLWQVSGKNHTTFNEMIRLDIQYAETASVWLDLKILAKTIPAVCGQVRALRRRQAARTNHQRTKVTK